ncbi:MAG: Clp protease N-terminal domain-containing protein [Gemmatimonadales bacterium]
MSGYNFTDRVRHTLQLAREEALALGHECVDTEHILLAQLRAGGVADAVFDALALDRVEVRQQVIEAVKPGRASRMADLPYTSRAKKTLELAMREARDLNHLYVGTEHLLLGLFREEKGIAAQILFQLGFTVEATRAEVVRLLGTMIRDDVRAAPEPRPSITVLLESADGKLTATKLPDVDAAIAYLLELRRTQAAS